MLGVDTLIMYLELKNLKHIGTYENDILYLI